MAASVTNQPKPRRASIADREHAALTESRVEEIAATLRDCSFRNGVTLPAFAAKWGLGMDRMHELSAIASRRVRAEVTDPDRVASKGFAMLEKIADDAIAHAEVDEENAAGHRAVAIKAVDTWITKSGVAAPTKAVVGVTGDLSALTDEQLEERKAAVLARLNGIDGVKRLKGGAE